MRSFSGSFNTQKNSLGTEPIGLIVIEFDSGDREYSDRVLSDSPIVTTAQVIDWGSISTEMTDDAGSISTYNFTLQDHDYELLNITRDEATEGITVSYYQCFGSLDISAFRELLFSGVITSYNWQEENQIQFTVQSFETLFTKQLGTIATSESFPKVHKDQQDQILPYVYGSVKRSSAIQVIAPARTTLAIDCPYYATETAVVDGSDFPQSESAQVPVGVNFFIGRELVYGYFYGNRVVLARRNMVIERGGTVGEAPNPRVVQLNLTPNGPNWIGYHITFYFEAYTSEERRIIVNFVSPDLYVLDVPVLAPPVDIYSLGELLPNNTPFHIHGDVTNHKAGEEVVEKLDEYVWIIHDGESDSVEKIEMESSIILHRDDIDTGAKNLTTFAEVDSNWYTVNLSDNQFSAEIGHNVTTITMPFDPVSLPSTPFTSNGILTTFVGNDLVKPVDIIEDLLDKAGITNIDSSSRSSVDGLSDWIDMAFTVTDKKSYLEFAYDIAFQSRISFYFKNDTVFFHYLENESQTASYLINDDDRAIDGIPSITRESTKDIINKVTYRFLEGGKDKRYSVTHDASITLLGEREKEISLWAHKKKWTAQSIATFWLGRWSDAMEIVEFTTYLSAVEVERYDWIRLDFDNICDDVKAQVLKVVHTGGTSDIDKITITARTDRLPGCGSSCEMYAETSCDESCEVTCVSSNETGCNYTCESNCQEACEVTCVTTCEVSCTTYDEATGAVCISGCQGSCQSSCETGDESCTTGCTTAYQSACYSGCEIACQVGCEYTME